MSFRNTERAYGSIAKGFHWIVAILVLGLLALGLYMVRLDPGPALFQLYALHKSIGIVVLALAVLRVAWRLSNIHPISLPNHRAWEKLIARISHALLYLALFVMPLSGWVMSSAKGFSVGVFGLFTLPDLVRPSEALAQQAVIIHEIAAYTLIGVIGLHVAGALKHHVLDRDNTLKRMLPFGRTE